MVIYFLIYGLVLAGGCLSLLNNPNWRNALQRLYLPFVFVTLVLFAALRAPGIDRDYDHYFDWYKAVSSGDLTPVSWAKDPAYVLISYLAGALAAPFNTVLFAFAVIITFSTANALGRIQKGRWFVLLAYLIFCRFYVPYGMTQIRAAAGIPMMCASIFLAYDREKVAASGLFLCALAFHLSVIIALPILGLAMAGVKFKSRAWILSLIPIGIGVFLALKSLLAALADFQRAGVYLDGNYDVKGIRLFSVYFLACTLSLFYVVLFLWKRIDGRDRVIAFSSAIGLFYQAVLSSNDALALRMSEVLGIFQVAVLTIPLAYIRGNALVVYIMFLLALGLVFFLSGLNYVQPYHWIL